MTMINSITPKGTPFPDGIISPDHPSVDGAMAIFDAIMVAVADWHGSDQDDTDMQITAEKVASQIMSDDSLKSYLDDANPAELLPVITNLLHHADAESDHEIPSLNPDSDNIKHQISDVFETPLANKIDAAIPYPDDQQVDSHNPDKSSPASGLITEYPPFQLSKPIPRQPRGQYETAKNPVQILASLIRKTESKPTVDEYVPAPAPASAPASASAPAPAPATASEPASEPVLSMVSHPPLKTWHPPLLPEISGDTTRYGPFPKSVSLAPAMQDASIKHMSMPSVEMEGENTASRMALPADIKKEPSPEPKGEYTTTKAAKPDHIITDMINIRSRIAETAPRSDEPSITASALKSQQLSSTLSAQQPSVSPSSTAMTSPPMTDTDHHGGFSGQQHNGQPNNQQNPQQGQADTMLDTRMGLDQGKDGRLLRLNMNDANWTDRLLRNIQSETGEGGDETIRVILEPARLGRLTVQVNITGNNTNVQITSVTAEAAAILGDAEPRLQQVFEQHGLKLGQMQTSMGQGFSNQWSQGQGTNSSERNHKTGTKNTAQDEEESTKILENAKTGQVNILA